jgi:Tetratricopeptide repeat
LLSRGDDDRSRVTGTWELSLASLEARGCPQARALLRFLSCFAAATPIPPDLLNPDVLGSSDGGIAGAEDGLSGLLATGLIEVRDGVGGSLPSVVVHPLVAETTRSRAGASLDASFARAAGFLNAAAKRLDTEDSADRAAWQAVLPHLRFLLTLKTSAEDTLLAALADSAARASAVLSFSGSYVEAFDLADAALARIASLDQDSVLTLRFQRATAARYLGHIAEAATEFGQVLTGRQESLGADHPDTLTAQHYVAVTLADRGSLTEAEAMFRQVLAKKLEFLGPDHPSTLATRHWIAAVLARQGMPEQAEAESRLVLDARRRVLGAEHPSTLATLHDVARYLAEQGRMPEAEAIFREVFAARSRVLGLEHPLTLETQYQIATVISEQGKTSDGQALLERILQAQTKVLGPDHPHSLRTAESIKRLQSRRAL